MVPAVAPGDRSGSARESTHAPNANPIVPFRVAGQRLSAPGRCGYSEVSSAAPQAYRNDRRCILGLVAFFSVIRTVQVIQVVVSQHD